MPWDGGQNHVRYFDIQYRKFEISIRHPTLPYSHNTYVRINSVIYFQPLLLWSFRYRPESTNHTWLFLGTLPLTLPASIRRTPVQMRLNRGLVGAGKTNILRK